MLYKMKGLHDLDGFESQKWFCHGLKKYERFPRRCIHIKAKNAKKNVWLTPAQKKRLWLSQSQFISGWCCEGKCLKQAQKKRLEIEVDKLKNEAAIVDPK